MVAPAPVLPTTRDENWKHAPLRGIERLQWAPPTALTQEALLAATTLLSGESPGHDRYPHRLGRWSALP
jgi:hypothetical protein